MNEFTAEQRGIGQDQTRRNGEHPVAPVDFRKFIALPPRLQQASRKFIGLVLQSPEGRNPSQANFDAVSGLLKKYSSGELGRMIETDTTSEELSALGFTHPSAVTQATQQE